MKLKRQDIERLYLNRNVEITIKSNETIETIQGILSSCEDDYIIIGGELIDSEEISRIKPLDGAYTPNNVTAKVIISTDDEIKEGIKEIEDTSRKLKDSINVSYVRKFIEDKRGIVYKTVDTILARYSNARQKHEDRPSDPRMQEMLRDSRKLYRANPANPAAAEIYAFILHVMGDARNSTKIYMYSRDFTAAFVAAPDIDSKNLAAVCGIMNRKINVWNMAALMNIGSRQLVSALKWLIDEIVNKDSESEFDRRLCFKYIAAISCKILGYEQWPNKSELFTLDNINAIRTWLNDKTGDESIIDKAASIIRTIEAPKLPDKKTLAELTDKVFKGVIVDFNLARDRLFGRIKCSELSEYDVPLKDDGEIFFHFSQISDRELRTQLLTSRQSRPSIEVAFKARRGLNANKWAAADDIQRVNKDINQGLSYALTDEEEGEIEFFRKDYELPFGKVWSNGERYTFNINNVIDNQLAVFLETEFSAAGHRVKFCKVPAYNLKGVQICNIKSAQPFPEYQIKSWEKQGLLTKAIERINKNSSQSNELDEEDSRLVYGPYMPLELLESESESEIMPVHEPEASSDDLCTMILDIHVKIRELIRRELVKAFNLDNSTLALDNALKSRLKLLDSVENDDLIKKTKQEYPGAEVGLLNILGLSALCYVMGSLWEYFAKFFADKSYSEYWEKRFDSLSRVRNAVFHANPDFLSNEDIKDALSIINEINSLI